jgi:hypothetical protein
MSNRDDLRAQTAADLRAAGQLLEAGPPDRGRLLARAFDPDYHPGKEPEMTFISRLFAGRTPAARLGLAALLLAALVATALLLPRGVRLVDGKPQVTTNTAWSMTDGKVLSWDISSVADPEPLFEQFKALKDQLKSSLPEGVQIKFVASVERRRETVHEGPAVEGSRVPRAPEAGLAPVDKAIAALWLTTEDDKLIEQVRAQVAAALPQLPAPTVSSATWFMEQNNLLEGGISLALNINGESRTFNFPDTASEAEIEGAVSQWLAERNDGAKFNVDVTITGDEQNRQIELKVTSEEHTGTPSR